MALRLGSGARGLGLKGVELRVLTCNAASSLLRKGSCQDPGIRSVGVLGA